MADNGVSFNPDTDIPSLDGKVILITGANSGLGRQSSLELAKHNPAQIWMAARSTEKGQAAVAEVKSHVPGAAVTFLELDLSSFESIKKAAEIVLASSPRLDILMLNAGLMGCPPKLTSEGYEIQMGTNHIGHALLLHLLRPLLLKTAISNHVRVVSLASAASRFLRPEKIQFETLKYLEGVSPVNRYIQSKVANRLYVEELAKYYPQLTIVSVNPGEVATQLFSREPGDEQMTYLQTEIAPKKCGPVEEGVKNQLWAATGHGVTSGRYYDPIGVYEPSSLSLDSELAERLWNWTQKELEGQTIEDI